MAAKKPAPKKVAATQPVRFSQSDFPRNTLQDAQRIAVGLWENYAGRSASPPDVALAIGVSPTSSAWRVLCGSSAAYELTTGGYNADQIALTALGRRLTAPEAEGDDLAARVDAVLKPRLMREFFERYRRAKFPIDTVGQNVLVGLGLPKDRASEALEILKANGRYAGIIRDTPTGPFVNLDSPAIPAPVATPLRGGEADEGISEISATAAVSPPPPVSASPTQTQESNRRVFVSHGKQRAFVTQLKELLTFGQLEPVVSVEREATAIPVPEKVFEDMRSCSAGVIHVTSEGECIDQSGNKHLRMNENVLIEIGAAMALYGKRVILLVEKGLSLPSNLQGLYRCDYEGDRLDYEATMKLLKTFNQFRA